MIRLLHDIKRLVLVVMLPMLLALAPAMAQTVVYKGTTTTLAVIAVPGHTYEWELYNNGTINFATVPGNCPAASANFTAGRYGENVNVQWNELGTYFFKVTARDGLGCAMNMKIGMIKVIPIPIEAVIAEEETIPGASGISSGACQLIKLNASKSVGENLVYNWSLLDQGGVLTRLSGISTEFSISPAFTGSLPANFRVRLLVTDNMGNKNSDTVTIKINPLPVVAVSSSGNLNKDGSMIVDAIMMAGSVSAYNWRSSEGQIIGPVNQPSAKLLGAGIYTLNITDQYGCSTAKDFRFPVEIDKIIANPDYARISWSRDTTINVMVNDHSTVDLIPGSVRVITQPVHGTTKVNADGSIMYGPTERFAGRDEFEYKVCDALSLCASAKVTIDIYGSELIVTEGFSPNGDGINDLLVFKGLENYLLSQLYVFTRSGQLVYQSNDYRNNWDGRIMTSTMTSQKMVPTGTYYYVLKLGGTDRSLKGFIYIGY